MMLQACSVLVYSENEGMVRELVGKARHVSDGAVGVLCLGQQGVEESGADVCYRVEDGSLEVFNPETFCDVLTQVIRQVDPDLVLVGASKQGLELAARVSERLNVGCATWCVDMQLDADKQEVTAQCMVYSGVGMNTYRITSRPAILTVGPGVFEADTGGKKAETVVLDVEFRPPQMEVLEQNDRMGHGERLADAPMIVDAGQGFREQADLELARQLAERLGGKVSCSRPLSSERDWFPEWIGLSGAQLSPELCFTIGVSGAIQHMIGIRGSKTIVAVNQDEHAGVHLQADYCVVADLYDFIPALLRALEKRSVKLVRD